MPSPFNAVILRKSSVRSRYLFGNDRRIVNLLQHRQLNLLRGRLLFFEGVILNDACAAAGAECIARRSFSVGGKDPADNARAMPTPQPPAGSPHPSTCASYAHALLATADTSSFVRYLILCISPLLKDSLKRGTAKCVVLDGG